MKSRFARGSRLVVGAAIAGLLLPTRGVAQEADEGRGWPTPLRDLGGAVVDFGRDTWHVASSPARLDRRSALEVAGVLLVGGVLFARDEAIQSYLEVEEPSGLHAALRDVGDALEPVGLQGNTNAIYAGTALLGYVTRQRWLSAPAKQILYSHWIGALARQLLIRTVGRRRPNDGFGAYTLDPGEGSSFPSGHSAAIVELAYVASHHIDWWPATVALYSLAGTVVFQRVDSGQHWASDAWLGAAWGYAVARLVVSAEEAERVSLRPGLDLASGRLSMGFSLAR